MKDERESTEFWKVEFFSFDVETLGKTDGLPVMLFFWALGSVRFLQKSE